jgi:hypothetical protein
VVKEMEQQKNFFAGMHELIDPIRHWSPTSDSGTLRTFSAPMYATGDAEGLLSFTLQNGRSNLHTGRVDGGGAGRGGTRALVAACRQILDGEHQRIAT